MPPQERRSGRLYSTSFRQKSSMSPVRTTTVLTSCLEHFAINIVSSISRCLLDAQEQHLIAAKYLRKTDGQENKWLLSEDKRIIVPCSFIPDFLKKLHIKLGHPGVTKLCSTISSYFEVKRIDKAVATVCQICTGCTENKATTPRCGLLVASSQSDNPLEKIFTDL